MSDRYFGLVASLPHLGSSEGIDFYQARMPISRENLKERLKSLSPKDFEQIKAIIDFQQSLYGVTMLTDRQVRDMFAATIGKLTNPRVRQLFTALSEIWTILEALHQRLQGVEYLLPPLAIVSHIRRNWAHPDFALAGRFTWIPTARDLLEQDKILELEKFMDRVRWQLPERMGITDPFSFESLVAYVGRWEILYNWSQIDQQKGQQRFDELVETVLKGT